MRWLFAIFLVITASVAVAQEHKHSHRIPPTNPEWKNECGSCHVTYPVRLLTENEWLNMMANLDHHFGSNAEVDEATGKVITEFLVRHAGHGERHQSRTLRISDTAWFQRRHRRFSRADWANPAVHTPANCTACHVKGEKGKWSERSIRLPMALRHKSHRKSGADA